MFCGFADGTMLPPYVVYKASNTYPGWCVGGPRGAKYNSTPSGWFENFVFSKWFHELYLPAAQSLPGRKVLIGDNLASHINIEVIDTCKQENIDFVCLPPNSTDKT